MSLELTRKVDNGEEPVCWLTFRDPRGDKGRVRKGEVLLKLATTGHTEVREQRPADWERGRGGDGDIGHGGGLWGTGDQVHRGSPTLSREIGHAMTTVSQTQD